MKFKFSKELVELFKQTFFVEEKAELFDLDNDEPVDITPDEDGWVYIPEMTVLSPTTLVRNGYSEYDCYDYVFIMKLINEFRKQALKENIDD